MLVRVRQPLESGVWQSRFSPSRTLVQLEESRTEKVIVESENMAFTNYCHCGTSQWLGKSTWLNRIAGEPDLNRVKMSRVDDT